MIKNIVITGAPGTGKTSIINELKKKKYNCYDEVSRKIISDQIDSNGDILPWKNLLKFSEKVFKIRKSQLLESNNQLYFFDRGIIDVYAYMEVEKLKIPKEYYNDCLKYRYNKNVFYTPIWEKIYQKDKQRKESINQAKLIESHIINSYKNFGYKLIKIPKTNINERVNFILSNISTL